MSGRSLDSPDRRTLWVDDELWNVSERDATGVPGARAAMCLIFESQAAVRRSWSFPPNWREMEDSALWRLSELTSSKSALIEALQTAFITSIIAHRTATRLIARTKGVLVESRALREQRKTIVRQCRAAREETHHCVTSYAREGRAAGKSVADILSSLLAPLKHTEFVVSDPQRSARLASDVARWCDEEFRAA